MASLSVPYIKRYAKWDFQVAKPHSMTTTNISLTDIEVTGPRIGNRIQRRKSRRTIGQNCSQ